MPNQPSQAEQESRAAMRASKASEMPDESNRMPVSEFNALLTKHLRGAEKDTTFAALGRLYIMSQPEQSTSKGQSPSQAPDLDTLAKEIEKAKETEQ